MPTWDEAAQWYLGMLRDSRTGFNELAADTALSLLGDVRGTVVIDVGCGEGHVARRLARAGARVVGVEPTSGLIAAARRAEALEPLGISYRKSGAEDLAGIGSDSADAVCAVLVLHHVAGLDAALGEIRRVVRVGGELVVVVPHPWTDHPGAEWVAAADGGVRRAVGDYAREGFWSSGVTATQDVGSVKDIGWRHRTLATWFNRVAAAGFRLTEVREPLAAGGEGSGPWSGLPRFLAFRAVRHQADPGG